MPGKKVEKVEFEKYCAAVRWNEAKQELELDLFTRGYDEQDTLSRAKLEDDTLDEGRFGEENPVVEVVEVTAQYTYKVTPRLRGPRKGKSE